MTFRETVSTLRADFAINEFAEPRITLAVWRLGQSAHGRPGPAGFAIRRLHGVLDQLWTRSVIGAELPRSVPAGPGLRLPHAGRGVVLHSATRLGSGVTLYHQVTLGVRKSGVPPVVGDDVLLGVGARVLGPVHLGDGCSVGANAVVVTDVPAGQVWVGIPARPTAASTVVDPGEELILDEAVLDQAVLDQAVLDQAVLDQAVLDKAVLDKAVLDKAVLDQAVLDQAVLDQAAAGIS